MIRISVGSFDFSTAHFMKESECYLFYFIWFLTVMITNIVMLNFLIAETSAIYVDVTEKLTSMKNREKSDLISEAEHMIFDSMKNDRKFPKFIIIRSL